MTKLCLHVFVSTNFFIFYFFQSRLIMSGKFDTSDSVQRVVRLAPMMAVYARTELAQVE